jgi:hypothetical protein
MVLSAQPAGHPALTSNVFPGTPDDPAPELVEQIVDLVNSISLPAHRCHGEPFSTIVAEMEDEKTDDFRISSACRRPPPCARWSIWRINAGPSNSSIRN